MSTSTLHQLYVRRDPFKSEEVTLRSAKDQINPLELKEAEALIEVEEEKSDVQVREDDIKIHEVHFEIKPPQTVLT